MLKIGEFSKLSHLTIKALRFYEKRGLLIPQKVDEQTGYRFYETSQLKEAARIKSYRQLGLTIEEIQAINKGTNLKEVLISKAKVLESQKEEIESRLLMIHHLLDDNEIQYQVIEKMIPTAAISIGATTALYCNSTLPEETNAAAPNAAVARMEPQ